MTCVDLPASTADLPKEKQLLMEEIMHCRYIEPDGKCWDNLPTLSTTLWMSEPSTAPLILLALGSHAIRAMWFRIRTASASRAVQVEYLKDHPLNELTADVIILLMHQLNMKNLRFLTGIDCVCQLVQDVFHQQYQLEKWSQFESNSLFGGHV